MNNQYTVMIAEDEDIILASLTRHVQAFGQNFKLIGTAQDGQQLLELIKQHVPNVVFTDIQMPYLDGIELIQRLDNDYPDMIKIIVTGYDKFEYAKKAVQYNVFEYLLKPVIYDDIHDVLLKAQIKLDKQTKDIKDRRIDIDEGYPIDKAINNFVEYLKSNYTEDINLPGLISDIPFNTTYFCRQFKIKTGMSPSKYLTKLRINKATQLLQNNPEVSIGEISELVGYNNQSYFSRIYKITTGISPVELRDIPTEYSSSLNDLRRRDK